MAAFTLPEKIEHSNYSKELKIAIEAAIAAGKEIMRIRESNELHVEVKEDLTLVTLADKTSNELICEKLMNSFPTYGLLTEEKMADAERYRSATEEWFLFEKTWIIDPLDGTQEFSRGGNEFGIHIALTVNGKPVLGINVYPAVNILYFAINEQGAYKKVGEGDIKPLTLTPGFVEILPCYSRSESGIGAIYEQLGKVTQDAQNNVLGSCGLRICSIAEGLNNLYIYDGLRAGLWDFCSGEVILSEAGGFISDWQGNPIDYRNRDAKLIHGVVVSSEKVLYERAIELLIFKG